MPAPEVNRAMLRVRDAIDRDYALELDVDAMAGIAAVSPAHLIRTFHLVFGETPHRYLQRRRVERAMFLLRSTDRSVTDVCFAVGFGSLGTFSRTFRDIVGQTPSEYREGHEPMIAPNCFQMAATRPWAAPRTSMSSNGHSSSFGEATDEEASVASGSA